MKENILRMKNDIKKLVAEQKITKENRKTVRFNGTRTMTTHEAAYKVILNRHRLRIYYQAYNELRGITEDHYGVLKESHLQHAVAYIVKKYTDEEALRNIA